MSKTPLIAGSLLLTFFLVGCAAPRPIVRTLGGQDVGEVNVIDQDHAVIYDVFRNLKAKVRGGLVRDPTGKKIGEAKLSGKDVLLLGDKGTAVGRMTLDMTCFAQDQTVIGRVSMVIDPEAAGAACLVLLIKRN